MPDSFEIGVEIDLTTNKNKFFDNIVKTVRDMRPIDIPTMLGKQALKGVPFGQRPRVQEEGGDWRWLKESEIGNNLLRSIQSSFVIGLGVLTGIFSVLKKVPSILQASLKLMSIGFLLILKPMADLIGMILMPIAKAMIKLAMFLGDFKIGAGVGGIAGMILAMLAAVLLAPATLSAVATGAVVLAAAFVGAILGSVLGAIIDYSWGKLIGLEKGIIGTLIVNTFKDKLDPEGFWGKIIGVIEEWVSDKKDMRSFWAVIADMITGDRVTGGKGGEKTNILSGILAGMGPFGMIADYARKSATGGVFTSPTPALIGEAGPEAVIPLNQLGSFGGTTINISGIVDEYKFRDIIKDVVRQENTAHYGVTGGSI